MNASNTSIRFIDDTHAQVTKAFQKKAVIFGTAEFKLWREYVAMFPGAQMVVKSIKKNENKRTNKNLTYKNIRGFLALQDNGKELLMEFERELKLSKIQESPYRAVLAWFKKKFPNYDEYKDFFKDKEESESNSEKSTPATVLPMASNQ